MNSVQEFGKFVVLEGGLLFILLAAVMFLVAFLQQGPTARSLMWKLSRAPLGMGNFYASVAGAVTPFCSCSTVPVLQSMLRAKIRFGFCMTFLLASPTVNEAALVVMTRYTSLWYVLLFLAITMFLPMVLGVLIEKLGFSRYLREAVQGEELPGRVRKTTADLPIPVRARLSFAWVMAKTEVRSTAPYLAIGIVVGGIIHGFVPSDWIGQLGQEFSPTTLVVLLALIGLPLYFNMVAAVPIAFELANKGLGLGPMMAFLVAGAGTSIPEMIMLAKMFKKELIATHIAAIFVSAVAVGLCFQYFTT